ncbi:uncharacterized protein YndB with AHSA1/START domain [Arthrobacter psychrochitiniphilus]|nr:uncharacterized protein YndB with AHSA1/START domain [Arthrobacter psychrochitiniphilus]
MTVTNTTKSTENLSLRITAEFSAAVERVWQIWEDPRQLVGAAHLAGNF